MASHKRFEKLLEPYHIGPVKTRNRIIKTAAGTNYWHEDQLHMTEQCLAFHEAIARGGVGLLIVEGPGIDYPYGVRWRERYRFDDDKYIEGMSELVQVIHKHDCPTFLQLQHDGPLQSPLMPNMPKMFEGPPLGASAVNVEFSVDLNNDVPRELTIPEIEGLVDKFASAAVRARKAGFDGVDINGASTHLIHSFLSPFWNRREDAYGGSREKRLRFLLEIVREIKKRAGQDFPISLILNGIERGSMVGIDDSRCLGAEEVRQNIQDLERAGVNSVMVRSYWMGNLVGGFMSDYLFFPEPPIPVNEFPKEYYWKEHGAGATIILSEEIKKVSSISTIVVGKISPELGERFLEEGRADFIGMTRPLFCDPDLPNKLAAGQEDYIRPCTRCGTCIDETYSVQRRCRLNAFLGQHEPYDLKPAEKKKRVVVVGGGPGGMEAARVAAERGHEVILYNKASKLGGLLDMAAVVKGLEQEDLPAIPRYFKNEFVRLGVTTRLGKAFDASMLDELKPDAVVVATGGQTVTPDIPGIDGANVINAPALHKTLKSYLRFFSPGTLSRLTKFWIPMGKKVVVIGGGLHGCEIAEFLVKRGRKVTIVETAEKIGDGMIDFRMGLLMHWFEKKGVEIFAGVKALEITEKGVSFVTRKEEKLSVAADSVVPAQPLAPDTRLFESLEGKVPELYAIGDCKEPRLIVDAIAEAFQTARNI